MSRYWEQLGEETVVDFPEWMKRYFMETIVTTTSSKPAHALSNFYKRLSNKKIDGGVSESEEYIEVAQHLNEIVHWFSIVPEYLRNFPGINLRTKKYKEKYFLLNNMILKMVKDRRAEIEATPEDQPLVPDMLTMFLTVNTPRDVTERIADDQNNKPMTDEEVVGNYFEVLGAGISTGSNAICFLVYYLSHHPDVKRKLLKEFEVVVGRNPNTKKITIDVINKLEYTEAFIKEVNRFTPIVPLIKKQNREPVEIGGIKFPANTIFFSSSLLLHRHKSQWSNPEEFNPDRFLKSSPESKNPFYMFGSGERKCPGRNLALLELKATLLLLYSKYDVELVDMNAPIKYRETILRKCTKLKVRIKKRRDLN
ncbi:13648_t:CDS:2 [Acaulospora colombiana]|uniref:13648_t:CDS:1 n=1 Tax=Acaulospora colombiana TaxID=27376 RepID=A0ACA9LDI5_9GLOM|nr:13648_t:CDS:2 [Acaulospora colombiana]